MLIIGNRYQQMFKNAKTNVIINYHQDQLKEIVLNVSKSKQKLTLNNSSQLQQNLASNLIVLSLAPLSPSLFSFL